MSGRRLRSLLVLVVVGAALARALGSLRPRPAPDTSRHPTVDGGVRPPTPEADPYQAPVVEPAALAGVEAPLAPLDADRLTDGPVAPPTPAEDPYQAPVVDPAALGGEQAPLAPLEDAARTEDAAPPTGTLFDVAGAEPPAVPAPTDAVVAVDEPETTGAQTWSAPVDGACPDGFPVKAKLRSGIYHLPGGLAYERTNPDRCYPTAEAAEADGLRAAKR